VEGNYFLIETVEKKSATNADGVIFLQNDEFINTVFMKTHTLTFKTHKTENKIKTPSLRDKLENWLIRKFLGRTKD
jgi:hypothetical protein